jgi:hypothetical protein
MKKIVTIFSFILAVILVKAQGNLQFSQVITQTGNLSVSSPCQSQSSATLTVPSNKVWKIESMSRCNPLFYLNGGNVNTCYYNNDRFNNSTATSMAIDNAPIWLKAGDAINFNLTLSCNANPGLVSYSYFISIIEYNIVP